MQPKVRAVRARTQPPPWVRSAQSDRRRNQSTRLKNSGNLVPDASIYFKSLALPAFMAAARAPVRPNCVRWPLIRWVAFKFLTTMIWKPVALPWREAITDQARKSSQICRKGLEMTVNSLK